MLKLGLIKRDQEKQKKEMGKGAAEAGRQK